MSSNLALHLICVIVCCFMTGCLPSRSADLLYKKLMNNYNPLIRPVANNSEIIVVHMGVALSQLVDIDEKNQIMITSVWLKQKWKDYKLVWDPKDFEGIEVMQIPIDQLWVPDIVLYNTAEGNYAVDVTNSANIRFDGTVAWNPPAIFRSSCSIDISYFPFDEQQCRMKFGTWTYDGSLVDLQPLSDKVERENYRENGEWEMVETPVERHTIKYPCCAETYIDVTYYFVLHRNPLFYVITLVIPCVLISLMTVLVFYLPSDAQEKITLSISVLLALIVFLLLIPDLIPPTSKTIPLIGQYMLFTMGMCSLSIVATVVTINWHFRTVYTHVMSPWVRRVFLEQLPWLLMMERPEVLKEKKDKKMKKKMEKSMRTNHTYNSYPIKSSVQNNRLYKQLDDSMGGMPPSLMEEIEGRDSEMDESLLAYDSRRKKPIKREWRELLHGLNFIEENLRMDDIVDQSEEEWRYVGLVIDRCLLWIFLFIAIFGSMAIILPAPLFWEPAGVHNTPVYEEPIILESLTYNEYINATMT
ncbi:neuronal acetylcholine receptor subunit alpha-6-like [Amphiura filiformis]|uniref:neuronal acetylcholine receptor subunit alpha-6-like n=1 Tax=Amphiura filiformis TaxID=82378 RepID=UPI003B20BF41